MSSPPSLKAEAASVSSAGGKPKRPLSGYNLFYRYKRNKVLEAASRGDDEEATISALVAAPSGLEGIESDDPLLKGPKEKVDEHRDKVVRAAMEGKLFPNENARQRLHRRVHGMGFVEMGRKMRQAWAQADTFTKDIFCELADIGRVRYKRLVTEYKLKEEGAAIALPGRPVGPSMLKKKAFAPKEAEVVATAVSSAAASAVVTAPMKTDAMAAMTKSLPVPSQVPSSSNPLFQALLGTTNNVQASSEPKKNARPAYMRRVSNDHGLVGPSLPDQQAPFAAGSMSAGGYRRLVSQELDRCGDALFEPLPVEAQDPQVWRQSRRESTDLVSMLQESGAGVTGVSPPQALSQVGNDWRQSRRVSTMSLDAFPQDEVKVDWSAGDNQGSQPWRPNVTQAQAQNSELEGLKAKLAMQQLLLKNAIAMMQGSIARNDALLPTEMRVLPQCPPQGVGHGNDGAAADATRVPSTGNACDFVDELEEAIDFHGIVPAEDDASGERGPSPLFGKPLHDKVAASLSSVGVPMPADIVPRTGRARMA